MTLAPGTKLGPYEIVAPLGAGGMGEVWRARDARLGRDVAIKALPAGFEQDAERVARFEREAKLLASLSHPNVAGIHGLELVEGHRYLVLEFVEGETLAARLARGAMPWREAADVCRQVAAGVEAAHDAGIVHRDLKPGNVMLRPDGTVKVLDFGLAKSGAAGRSGSDPNLSASPTMTYAATQHGVILGTAAYMSPEQARGRAVDRRTDVWSFGCVLYECLTGRKVYDGETVSDMVARILEREPDWSALPAGLPAPLRALLERCLTKDPKARLQAIGEARIALESKLDAAPAATAPAAAPRRAGAPLAVLATVALAALAIGFVLPRPRHGEAPRATRLSLVSTGPYDNLGYDIASYALAPDGHALAYAVTDSTGTNRIAVRGLDGGDSKVLEGTEGVTWPFWSPDSREVAFFADGKLQRVPAAGGAVRTVCTVTAARGGSWGSAGLIVYSPDPHDGIWVVPADGGTPRRVTNPDSAAGESGHRFPCFLPDGRHFLFAVFDEGRGVAWPIRVGSVDGMRPRDLLRSSYGAVFAAPDQVVYTSEDALLAQRIDLRSFAPKGKPRLLRDRPEVSGSTILTPIVSCSATGLMAYAPRDDRLTAAAWVGADGRLSDTRLRIPGSVAVGGGALSPDGWRIAANVSSSEGYADWVGDLRTGNASLVVPPARGVFEPIWWPDGRRLAGVSTKGVFVVDPAGTADSALGVPKGSWVMPSSFSPDGRTLMMNALVPGHRYDIQTLAMTAGATPKPYLATSAAENYAHLSHDGHWLACLTDASGRPEIQVEHFPDHAGAVHANVQANYGIGAIGGGLAWRADDRAIYFVGQDGVSVMACEVRTSPQLSLGEARLVCRVPHETQGIVIRRDGAVLALLPWGPHTNSITIASGWQDEPEDGK